MSQKDTSDEDFAALFAASEVGESRHGKIEVGDVVRGRVIALGAATGFVGIGGKGEATIDLTEFRNPETGEVALAVGDELEATVVDDGSRSGSIVLKRTLGRGGHLPAELEQALAHRIPIEGLVTAETKGGFEVRIGGVQAFCPGSQIDRRRGERVLGSQYVGQRFNFRVIKIEAGGRNVVVSRRELLEEEAAVLAAQTWERLHVGAVVTGTVTNIREFGAFVDLGGVEGLIHISELGHGRVGHPSDVLQVGQVVEAQVIKLDPPPAEGDGAGRRQIGLSMKALAADPWTTVRERCPVGATLRGVVRRVEPFGAFVEVAAGLDGLVHVSKLALDRRVSHARQVVNIGQEVEVTILAIDPEKRRISLSMIEQARSTRDNATVRDRAEEQVAVAKVNERQGLGTFADLLGAPKKPR
jgi:small subunit ribosomal protein S1